MSLFALTETASKENSTETVLLPPSAEPSVSAPPPTEHQKLTLRLWNDVAVRPPTCASFFALKPEMRAELLEEMEYWVDLGKGVGIAAPQLGVPVKAILARVGGKMQPFFDPVILESGPPIMRGREGCLSIPMATVYVNRPHVLTVAHKAEEDGPVITTKVEGFEARILSHEIDHLRGLLITDHCSSLVAKMATKTAQRFLVRQAKKARDEISRNQMELRPGVNPKRLSKPRVGPPR